MAEENQGNFKVTDRRLFNPDGTLREDALIEEPPAQAPAAENLSSLNSGISGSAYATATATELQPESLEPENEDVEASMFNEFLMSIASSAFIYLGLVEHPATGRRQIDRSAAKEAIDMLVMLREKTRGNLTRGEEKFFDDLLSDLKMQYVSMRR